MTISPAFVFFLVFAVYQASGEVNTTVATCGDVLPNCQSYGKVVCDHPYQSWARKNCAKFCSFCGDNACKDILHNCETYGTAACKSPYVTWATKNCARYCGICGTIKVPTHPPLAPSTAGCHDEVTDCSSYGPDACKQYETWARQNCASFCGFCTTTKPTIPAYFYTGTFPPGSNGTLNRCFYKGQFYQTNDSWQDGCEFNCTCTDDTRGRYMCSTLCYTWTLPSVCHLETPPGKCCAKPVCPANFQIQYPPGYVDHDV
ncbi:uncharacterized protein LOC110450632 [Mizuhopecten yessoensis]|uniref:uncharacterized protein LOC110450632 n=1 Tax=Mizuhopecten yessoensis TaxID=6573 RepID=UPI000B45A6F0|nr:uncharacterized protein LOC110450632 [Mizuhopecten yessoensis]XP_021353926.1 uncharacterized protein LOC110450632 [Mizuhopecten yessoensis]